MITGIIKSVRALLAFAPEDHMRRERYLRHEWVQWEPSMATCRWCGHLQYSGNVTERCKVRV